MPDSVQQRLEWKDSSSGVSAGSGEVHLWRACLEFPETQAQYLSGLLPPEERARAERIIVPAKRRQQALSMGLLRVILGHYLAAAPASLQFEAGPKGKPVLGGPHAGALHFNLSHSGAWALYAVTRGAAVGVDLEEVNARHDYEGVARRFFSAAEQAALAQFPEGRREEAFYRCWTGKEAVLKATGEGLSFPLDQCEILVHPDTTIRLLSLNDPAHASQCWSLCSCEPAQGFFAACAVMEQPVSWHAWDVAGVLGPAQ